MPVVREEEAPQVLDLKKDAVPLPHPLPVLPGVKAPVDVGLPAAAVAVPVGDLHREILLPLPEPEEGQEHDVEVVFHQLPELVFAGHPRSLRSEAFSQKAHSSASFRWSASILTESRRKYHPGAQKPSGERRSPDGSHTSS